MDFQHVDNVWMDGGRRAVARSSRKVAGWQLVAVGELTPDGGDDGAVIYNVTNKATDTVLAPCPAVDDSDLASSGP